MRVDEASCRSNIGYGRGRAYAQGPRVEPGQLVLTDRHDRDPSSFQVFEGRRDVEDRLRAGADDRHRGPRQLLQVGRDVEGRRMRDVATGREWAAMDAADP